MPAPLPTAVLTSASPAYELPMMPGDSRPFATSGVTGAGVIRIQHRVRESDDWVDSPGSTFATGQHLSGDIDVAAPFNRIVVTDPDGSTDVALYI